jgi:hypothetical protein
VNWTCIGQFLSCLIELFDVYFPLRHFSLPTPSQSRIITVTTALLSRLVRNMRASRDSPILPEKMSQ